MADWVFVLLHVPNAQESEAKASQWICNMKLPQRASNEQRHICEQKDLEIHFHLPGSLCILEG